MMPVLLSLLAILRDSFRTRVALQSETLALRHQLLILQRKKQKQRLRLSVADRFLWVWLSRIWADWGSADLPSHLWSRGLTHHDASVLKGECIATSANPANFGGLPSLPVTHEMFGTQMLESNRCLARRTGARSGKRTFM